MYLSMISIPIILIDRPFILPLTPSLINLHLKVFPAARRIMMQAPILMRRYFSRHTHGLVAHLSDPYAIVLQFDGVDVGDLFEEGGLDEGFAVDDGEEVATLVVGVGDTAVVVFAEAAVGDVDQAGGGVRQPGDRHGADGFVGFPEFEPVLEDGPFLVAHLNEFVRV